jgi:hypothetical protein
MAQYFFKYQGHGTSPQDLKEKINQWENLVVVQETENELVISGPRIEIKQLSRELEGWFSGSVNPIQRPPTGSDRHGKVHRY